MKRNLLLVMIFSFAVMTNVMAQRIVSGTVTSAEDGSTVPGVNVVLKGTTTGVTTDIDGNYRISVPEGGGTLVFSFIGLASQEVEIGARSVVDVSMESDVKQLTEVVVVGYGTTTRQSFTGSMKQVEAELLERKSVSNVSQALAGEVAGVNVTNPSGQPGTQAIVQVRGIGSVNGNSTPLYVVDGVPYFGSINAINPADIKSVTVLKDATATSIYGSRGANGVILVTTKKGRAGDSFIEVDGKYGQNFSTLPRYERITSPEEYIGISWNALQNRGQALGSADPSAYANTNLFSSRGIHPFYNMWDVAGGAELIDPATGAVRSGVQRKYDPENWGDYAFQPSNRFEGNVRIGGGDSKVNYFTSFGYLNDIGYSVNSDFERYSARLNLTHQVKEWLSGGLNIGYARSETNNGGQSDDSGSIFWFVDNIPSIYPLFLRDDDGNRIDDPYYGGYVYDYGTNRGFGGLTNAISDARNTVQNRINHDLNGNASLNIDFTDFLRFESRYGWQYSNSSYDEQNSPFYGPSANVGGSIYKTKTEIFTYNFTNLLRFQKSFDQHSFEALVAHESNKWERKYQNGFKQQLVDPHGVEFNNAVVTNPSNSYTRNYAIESYFSQINYAYKDTYFLTGTVRRDGSSRFVNNKWGTFGAVGVGWVLSNEAFMGSQNVLSFAKLKASYGLTGEQSGIDYYAGYDLYEITNVNDLPAVSFDTKGNPDLTWETSNMLQFGAEFSIGKFIDASVDYYIKTTDNLIFDRRVGPSIGYAIVEVNDGKLRNSGLEFDVTGHLVSTSDFSLDLKVNGEIINNELLNMPIDPTTGKEKPLDVSTRYGRAVGHSIYDYYMREWAGVDPATGAPQWNLYYDDVNGDGEYQSGVDQGIVSLHEYLHENPDREGSVLATTTESYTDATQKFVGKSAIPDVRGAINLSAVYKGIEISILWRYGLGGYSFDYTYADLMSNDRVGNANWHVDIRDRWMQEGDVTNVPRLNSGIDQNVNSTSTRFLIKSSFLNLSNVRIGYTVPSKISERIGVRSLSFFASGDNLLIFTRRKGFNPMTFTFVPSDSEIYQSERYTYDPLSTVTGGIKIRF